MTRRPGAAAATIVLFSLLLAMAGGCSTPAVPTGGSTAPTGTGATAPAIPVSLAMPAGTAIVAPSSPPTLPSIGPARTPADRARPVTAGTSTAATTMPATSTPATSTGRRESDPRRATSRTPVPTSVPSQAAGGSHRPAEFVASAASIDAGLARRMRTSWHAGCPVPLSDLTYLRLTYLGFDETVHLGEMVVATSAAAQITAVFRLLFEHRYPIRLMRLVDDFGGSDDVSMGADNTSAFNCRPSTGGSTFSQHSYGRAVDLNPVENPYVSGVHVLPPAGSAFAARPDVPGVIHDGDSVVTAFASIGWTWGGDWSSPRDYQHFSANGR